MESNSRATQSVSATSTPGPNRQARESIWLVAIVAIAFLGSISSIQYVTLDDRWYAGWVWGNSWTVSAYDLAVAHGRLLKPSSYTYFFPYLIDNAFLRQLLRLGTIVMAAWVFARLLQNELRGRGTALLFFLFFFAFARVDYDHNLFVSYPFAWEFSWLTWLTGLLGLLVAIRRQHMLWAIIGAILWLIGLQEGFVPHTIVLVVATIAESRRGRKSYRYLMPYLAGLAIWLCLWLVWRIVHPSLYAGSQLSLGSISTVVLATVNYSLGGMPLLGSLRDGGMRYEMLLNELDVLAFIKALAVVIATMRISMIASLSKELVRWRKMAVLSSVLVSLVFLPNILISMTPQYQSWMRNGVHAYLYSHFSYFAWIGLCALAALVALRVWPSRLLAGGMALVAGFGSLVVDASNASVIRQQEQFARRWQTMEQFMRSAEFSAVPDSAAIWMVDTSVTGVAADDAYYWNLVVRAKTGKNLIFTSDSSAAQHAPGGAYYLYLYDEPESENQYVLFARVTEKGGKNVANHVTVFPNSRNRSANISGVLACDEGKCLSSVEFQGKGTPELFSEAFSVGGAVQLDVNRIPHYSMDISSGVDVRTLRVSFARNPPLPPAAVALVAEEGFHGWESGDGVRWNWAGVEASLEVRNALDREVSLLVEFWLVAGDGRVVQVLGENGEMITEFDIDGHRPASVSIPLMARPGNTRLNLRTDTPALHNDGAARQLAYQVRSIQLRLVGE